MAIDDLSNFKARRWAAEQQRLAKIARDNADNDHETLIRVTCPQDVYDALDLIHARCIDHLDGPGKGCPEHPITRALGEFLDRVAGMDEEIRP